MRVEVKARNNAELIRKLREKLGPEVTEVYINLRPTKEIVVRILENAPNVRKISCPPSLYPKVSKKIIHALSQIGVQLVPEGYPRGRPRKYDEKTVQKILTMLSAGKGPKEISSSLGIPLRTVYYLIERAREVEEWPSDLKQ
ncbi:DUF1699 family protein [Thermococcus gammatolerans]|uniref:Uncharacterized protein n=1 Tax=Thermococcus gammatolerans (strain DSM 15229 / JCM 11827 / EJ3) TaxID=593117 RepID=C5A6R8_THEGJ|nr:DUF1699 family protein [Thermococcus gammatolerans]ACS33930.1 Conserved hypothetical protein [Thermococcus gammatolerans EJ3]